MKHAGARVISGAISHDAVLYCTDSYNNVRLWNRAVTPAAWKSLGKTATSISADRDWICPPATSIMEEASRLTVTLGHSSLVLSEEVYRHVLWALRHKGRVSVPSANSGDPDLDDD